MALESQQKSGLSADEIIHLAKSYDFTVSKRQLSRWQTQGLIPRPRQLHKRGIAGSHSVYPLHTGVQVCSLCKIATHFKDQERIGWYLWRLGWPVDEKYWKPAFAETLNL